MKLVRLGTRGSPLALWQADYIQAALQQQHPDCRVEIIRIKTEGDKLLTASLAHIGGKGVFVKEIEEALLINKIDLAVHSAKDVPTELPAGLEISCIPERADAHDILLTRDGRDFADIPDGALIGTGSLRRRAQMQAARPDLRFIEFRGNLETRYQKFLDSEAAGLVLAQAGDERLGWTGRPWTALPYTVCLPAVGQAALAVETRAEDTAIRDLLSPLHHTPTALAVTAERSFLSALGGGCQAPIAAFGLMKQTVLTLEGAVLSVDGARCFRELDTGTPHEAAALGAALAMRLLQQGAAEIISELEEGPDS